MEDFKELKVEADTFEKLRRDTNIVLQKALGTMLEKESMEGKVTVTIDVKMVQEYIPNYDPDIEGESRKILKPKFEHKVTSAINIKNEEKGGVNPEMAMVWNDDRKEYVLEYVNNTAQRSIFDTDFQEKMSEQDGNVVEDGTFREVPMLEGEVADEGALPGPVTDAGCLPGPTIDDGYGYEDVI